MLSVESKGKGFKGDSCSFRLDESKRGKGTRSSSTPSKSQTKGDQTNVSGRDPVSPSHLSLEDRRRRLKELKAKTECRACGGKGHWAHDRECAMSSSSLSNQNQTRTASMATRQHLPNQANRVGVCFVLNDYSDDPDTSAVWVGQNVPLPTESAEQLPPLTSRRVVLSTIMPWMTTANHG